MGCFWALDFLEFAVKVTLGLVKQSSNVKHGSESRVHLAGCVKADDWKAGRAQGMAGRWILRDVSPTLGFSIRRG